MDAVEVALGAVAREIFEGRREFATARQGIIAANRELQERELIKMATLGQALAEALRRRGTAATVADLAAEAGIVVFRIAFERWVGDAGSSGPDAQGDRSLDSFIEETVAELASITAEGPKRAENVPL